MRSQYIIIAVVFITLIATMLMLTYTENEQRHAGNDFWSVYFLYPMGSENDFVIDNVHKDSLFIYKVHSNDQELQRGEITMKRGEQKIIEIEKKSNIIPVTVTITDGYSEKVLEKK
jgi:hypothetical protein